MNIKKIIALALAGALATAAFTACQSSSDDSDVPSYSQNLSDNGLFKDGKKELKAEKYIDLADYSNMQIAKSDVELTDEELEDTLKEAISSYATTEEVPRDEAVADGDTLNIDYVGSVDGIEFVNGSTNGRGTTLVVGSGTYLRAGDITDEDGNITHYQGFEEQLIGHKAGDSFDIDVMFPEGYNSSTDADGNEVILGGKAAVFHITINSVKRTSYPEITDEFVRENFADQYENAEDMIAQIKENAENVKLRNAVGTKLYRDSEVKEYPQVMTDYEKTYIREYFTNIATQYGTTLDELISSSGEYDSVDDFIDSYTDDIQYTVKGYLICQAIVQKENIKATDDDIKEYFVENVGTEDYSSYEEQLGKPYLKLIVLMDKYLDAVVEKVELV